MGRKTVYNNITSPEKLNKINPKNVELRQEWIEYLRSVDRSGETIEQYINDLNIFLCWLLDNSENKFFIDLTKRDVMKYQNYLLNTLNLSSNRIRRLKATISSLSNYIVNILDEEYPEFKNIVNKIPPPMAEAVREKTVLQDEQVKLVLEELVKQERYQMACVLALAAYSGSRKSELLRFKVSHFKEEHIVSGLYRTPEKIKTKGRGKLGKQLNKFVIASPFDPYLKLWLDYRKAIGVPDEMDDLFVSYKDGAWCPLPVSTLDVWTETLSKLFGVNFYFHCLRHFFTTSLYQAGIPADVIKEVVGWASVTMVSLYNDTEISDEFGKYFGDEGIRQKNKKEEEL
jgi:integrase